MRRYKSGTAWAVWRWTDVDWKGITYLLRLHIFKAPKFAVMLHWIKSADPHSDPHDHPVTFLSVTIRGGYVEILNGKRRDQRIRFTRATDIHRIIEAQPGTLTLVFAGPGVRSWGFHTPGGFVPWKEYRDEHARRVGNKTTRTSGEKSPPRI